MAKIIKIKKEEKQPNLAETPPGLSAPCPVTWLVPQRQDSTSHGHILLRAYPKGNEPQGDGPAHRGLPGFQTCTDGRAVKEDMWGELCLSLFLGGLISAGSPFSNRPPFPAAFPLRPLPLLMQHIRLPEAALQQEAPQRGVRQRGRRGAGG